MKTSTALIVLFFTSTLHHLTGQTTRPYRPAGLPANDPAYNPPPIEFTEAELATPPVGQIQKSYLREVNQIRTILSTILSAVPPGEEGQGSPWFPKAQAYKKGLDNVASTCLQSDCFLLIPIMAEFFSARESTSAPDFAWQCAGLANGFGNTLVHAIERHIINQNGIVAAADLSGFIAVFSKSGFITENDIAEGGIQVDSAGIMILDAAAVVTQLQSRPWEEAEQFLRGQTAAQAFARYAASGNGVAILKTKYTSDQATIIAKWNELAAWVVTQRPPK